MIQVTTLLSLLWLAQPAPEPSAAPQPLSASSAAEAPSQAKVPTLEIKLDGSGSGVTQLLLGEPLSLSLTAHAHRQDVLFPPLVPALGSFRVVETLPTVERADGERLTRTWTWRIIPTRLGAEKIPAIELPYQLADGTQGSISSEPQRTFIRGHLENETSPALTEAPAPTPIITTNWVLIWGLGVLATALVAALLTTLVLVALRHRFAALRPKAPPRPANEVALARLAELEATHDEELSATERLAEATNAWRGYLAGRYDLDALEMTNDELSAALPQLDLKGVAQQPLQALLDETALVKFAGLKVDAARSTEVIHLLRAFVEQTWQAPEQDEDIRLKAEPASLTQRTYAGALDVGLGLVLGGLLILLLSLQGLGGLSGLGLLVTSAYLGLRDVAGLSLGKRLLRLTLVERNDLQAPPELPARLKRNLLLWMWPLGLPLEYLILRAHPLEQRLGDHWSETEVVRELGEARRFGAEEASA